SRSIPVAARTSNPTCSGVRVEGWIPPHRHCPDLRQRIRRRRSTPQKRDKTRRCLHNHKTLEQRPRIRNSTQSLRGQSQAARTEISRPLSHPLACSRDQKRELDSSNQIIE